MHLMRQNMKKQQTSLIRSKQPNHGNQIQNCGNQIQKELKIFSHIASNKDKQSLLLLQLPLTPLEHMLPTRALQGSVS